MKPAFAFALAAGVLLAGAAHAVDVYKWTDSKGVVHYGDRPASGVATSTLNVPQDEPADADAALAQQRLASARDRLQQQVDSDHPAPVWTARRPKVANSSCAAAWQRYNAAQACFDRYRVIDGKGVTAAGVQTCPQLPQPSCTP